MVADLPWLYHHPRLRWHGLALDENVTENHMKSCLGMLFCFIFSLAVIPNLDAQASYAAERNARISVGAGWSYLNTDYAAKPTYGPSFFADIDLFRHVGLEGEGHLGGVISVDDIGENSYLAGPRAFLRRNRFTGYGKLMVGRGIITNQLFNLSSTFNIYAYGGGLEYRAARRVSVRAIDFEMQKWSAFPPNGLSPLILTVGASYIIR